jgi:hypothetical protein
LTDIKNKTPGAGAERFFWQQALQLRDDVFIT